MLKEDTVMWVFLSFPLKQKFKKVSRQHILVCFCFLIWIFLLKIFQAALDKDRSIWEADPTELCIFKNTDSENIVFKCSKMFNMREQVQRRVFYSLRAFCCSAFSSPSLCSQSSKMLTWTYYVWANSRSKQ